MCDDLAVKQKYVKVTRSDQAGSYVQPKNMLDTIIDAEFDGLDYLDDGTSVTLTVVSMTDKEYEALSEFDGW